MPIRDQGYQRYTGPRRQPGRAWLVIARSGLRALVGRRSFVALIVLAWLPFVARVVQLYASAAVPQASFLAPGPELFRDFLDQQRVFALFVTVYAGAGLIANDRRTNALQLYLSKPLTRREYVCGKFAIVASCL